MSNYYQAPTEGNLPGPFGRIPKKSKRSTFDKDARTMLQCNNKLVTRLSYTDYTNDVILGISTGGGVNEQVPNLVGLGPELELVV